MAQPLDEVVDGVGRVVALVRVLLLRLLGRLAVLLLVVLGDLQVLLKTTQAISKMAKLADKGESALTMASTGSQVSSS